MTLIIRYDHAGRGWMIVRTDYGTPYEMHAHIKRKNDCEMLIKLIEKQIMPRDKWLRGSVRRLLYDCEFICMKEPKDRYYNYQRR